MDEKLYLKGHRAAYRQQLQHCIERLGYVNPKFSWISEREEAIAVLRRVCEEHGDNDWTEDLHLADVIDKYLARYLEK